MGHQQALKGIFTVSTKMPTVWLAKLFYSTLGGRRQWGPALLQHTMGRAKVTVSSRRSLGRSLWGNWVQKGDLQATAISTTGTHVWAWWAVPHAITEIALQLQRYPPPITPSPQLLNTNINKTGIFFPSAGTYGRSLHWKQCCILGKQNIFLLKRRQIALSKALLFAFLWQY